jgi:hypothetical protein
VRHRALPPKVELTRERILSQMDAGEHVAMERYIKVGTDLMLAGSPSFKRAFCAAYDFGSDGK